MFLRSNVLNSLMKQAYKTGLTVAIRLVAGRNQRRLHEE